MAAKLALRAQPRKPSQVRLAPALRVSRNCLFQLWRGLGASSGDQQLFQTPTQPTQTQPAHRTLCSALLPQHSRARQERAGDAPQPCAVCTSSLTVHEGRASGVQFRAPGTARKLSRKFSCRGEAAHAGACPTKESARAVGLPESCQGWWQQVTCSHTDTDLLPHLWGKGRRENTTYSKHLFILP